MELNLIIHNIKSVDDLVISFPVERGLYAITGQNGSGKSTIATCASRAFFKMDMDDYFGQTADDSFIECELNGIHRKWYKIGGKWEHSSNGKMEIKGFYEGSLIYGNRFRNTSYEKLRRVVETVNEKDLSVADEFIRTNLGNILQGNSGYYEKMWFAHGANVGLRDGYVFYYEKNGRRVSQFHMSTGENLLVSILNSIYIRNNDRGGTDKPCMFFLDEIELALHPSSLKRLLLFLDDVSKKYNYAVYFSTHSIELISGIKPQNIFYVDRYTDNTIEVINPCYPAYATKFLYDQSGYDNIILVEDDLAKEIIDKIIRKERLMNSRLVHILPCGGWFNVINLADDSLRNYLLGKRTSLSVILDEDIKEKAVKYMIDKNIINMPISYLPIESLEKYLRSNLYIKVDSKLFRLLNDYVFQQESLQSLIHEYKTNPNCKCVNDDNGKRFYSLLEKELVKRRKDRHELINVIVDYLMAEQPDGIKRIVKFLHEQLD